MIPELLLLFTHQVVSDSLVTPMNCSMPGFPVLHYLPEFAQTHVHPVGDAIQPSHPLSPLLLLPSIFPSIRVFSNESDLCIRWPKYWSFSFSISPSSEYSGLISFKWTGVISLQSKGLSRVFSNTTVQKHQFFSTQPSLWSSSHIHTCLLETTCVLSCLSRVRLFATPWTVAHQAPLSMGFFRQEH